MGTDGKAKVNSLTTFSYVLLHMDTPVLADQQNFTFISFVLAQDAV